MSRKAGSSLTIISAAAGSGKTYTLVQRYLIDLLGAPHQEGFKEMLAITFTNKAVFEMKQRIITNLAQLAQQPDSCEMGPKIQEELDVSLEEIQQRATRTLKRLLQDYGAFDVITIDRFNHRLIRTFAFDLQLPYGFEVVVQTEEFLRTLVDKLIAAVGEHPVLTKILVDFTVAKIADQNSWDVGIDLLNVTPMLLNENDRIPLASLKKLTLNDLKGIKTNLQERMRSTLSEIQTIGRQTKELIQSVELEANDFSRQTLFTHFTLLEQFDYAQIATAQDLYKNQLALQLAAEKPLYKDSLAETKKASIDSLRPSLFQAYTKAKQQVFLAHQYRSLLQQLTPLSLLGQMEKQMEQQQREQNKMLLARFNERIAKVVAHQPAPFIYERLGEKYFHYYIDEFQDTSILQWHNLIPLVGNSLDGFKGEDRKGSLFIVGDPKQAIYRWRGGDVRQFLSLLQKQTPFQQAPEIIIKKSNYRSAPEIVAFNNSLFAFLGAQLTLPEHRELFCVSAQQKAEKKALQGGVKLQFIEKHGKKEERAPKYLEALLSQIKEVKGNGFDYGEMAILIRQKEEGQQIAHLLFDAEIPAISSEALLLASSPNVNALIALMQLAVAPKNPLPLQTFFDVLHPIYGKATPHFDFVNTYIHQAPHLAFKKFNLNYNTAFEWVKFCSSNPYEAIEYCLSILDLPWKKDPYVQFFLDEVHQYIQSKEASWERFLQHWEHQRTRLSLQLSDGLNAIQIMTIHKAKGLEFPVVFLPFLEHSFQPKSAKVWMNLAEGLYPLSWGQFNASKVLLGYPKVMAETYQKEMTAAIFDAANVLYVACTRAQEQLYVTTCIDSSDPLTNYASLITHFMQSLALTPTPNSFQRWGANGPRTSAPNKRGRSALKTKSFELNCNLHWRSRLIYQLPQSDTDAQHFGIVIHEILKNIRSKADVNPVLNQAEKSGQLAASERKRLELCIKQLLDHPDVAPAFDPDNQVWIEQDILLPGGNQLRPDRFASTSEGILLIDFKTGRSHKNHHEQVQRYAEALTFLQQPVSKKILVYLNDGIEIQAVA